MGKIILILLLLFNLYASAPPKTGEQEVDKLDHYMELLERRDERGPVSLEEQVRVLSELGITLSNETIKEYEAFEDEYGFEGEYWLLLESEGWGTYDYENDTWTPSSSQVYAFDGEVFDVEHMYQIYFQGLQSISEGELTFGDVTADYSRADLENRGGTVDIRFTLNGKECRFKAEYMGDWLDLRIRDAVNAALGELGIEKRFYATDGSQGEIIFFCTEEWARAFEEATLCYISDTAGY